MFPLLCANTVVSSPKQRLVHSGLGDTALLARSGLNRARFRPLTTYLPPTFVGDTIAYSRFERHLYPVAACRVL